MHAPQAGAKRSNEPYRVGSGPFGPPRSPVDLLRSLSSCMINMHGLGLNLHFLNYVPAHERKRYIFCKIYSFLLNKRWSNGICDAPMALLRSRISSAQVKLTLAATIPKIRNAQPMFQHSHALHCLETLVLWKLSWIEHVPATTLCQCLGPSHSLTPLLPGLTFRYMSCRKVRGLGRRNFGRYPESASR